LWTPFFFLLEESLESSVEVDADAGDGELAPALVESFAD